MCLKVLLLFPTFVGYPVLQFSFSENNSYMCNQIYPLFRKEPIIGTCTARLPVLYNVVYIIKFPAYLDWSSSAIIPAGLHTSIQLWLHFRTEEVPQSPFRITASLYSSMHKATCVLCTCNELVLWWMLKSVRGLSSTVTIQNIFDTLLN